MYSFLSITETKRNRCNGFLGGADCFFDNLLFTVHVVTESTVYFVSDEIRLSAVARIHE